jgi:acyl carrier protein
MRATESELLDLMAKEAIVDRGLLVRDATLENLGVSSMDVMTTVFEIEEKYGVSIEADDMPAIKTVGDLTDFLLSRINNEEKTA